MNKRISISGDIGYVKGVLEGTMAQTDGKIKECSGKAFEAMGRIQEWFEALPRLVIAVDEASKDGDYTATTLATIQDGKIVILDVKIDKKGNPECYGCSTGGPCMGGPDCLSNNPR